MAATVLIVDDHPGFRAAARRLLELEGYEVVGEAEDGMTALERIHELRPEVVLLDVQLPDIDGFEVAERLSTNGFMPAVVLEVIGAEITLSPIHTVALGRFRPESGLAIRYPRFTGRWRDDKAPEDATTVEDLIEMYQRAKQSV